MKIVPINRYKIIYLKKKNESSHHKRLRLVLPDGAEKSYSYSLTTLPGLAAL